MTWYPTPNYVLTESYSYSAGSSNHDSKTLAAGSFVRPIDPRYVPKHVLDNPKYVWFNKNTEVFVYCKYGIIVVPLNIIRES